MMDEIEDELQNEEVESINKLKNDENIQSFKSNELKSHATIAKEEYGINFYEQSDEKDMQSVKEILSNEDYIEELHNDQKQDPGMEEQDDVY